MFSFLWSTLPVVQNHSGFSCWKTKTKTLPEPHTLPQCPAFSSHPLPGIPEVFASLPPLSPLPCGLPCHDLLPFPTMSFKPHLTSSLHSALLTTPPQTYPLDFPVLPTAYSSYHSDLFCSLSLFFSKVINGALRGSGQGRLLPLCSCSTQHQSNCIHS